MEVGRIGADGLSVASPVELDLKNVLDPVRAHLQAMAGKRARDYRSKNSCVAKNPALVRPTLTAAVLFISLETLN